MNKVRKINAQKLSELREEAKVGKEMFTIVLLTISCIAYAAIVAKVTLNRGYIAIGGEMFVFFAFVTFSIMIPNKILNKKLKRITEISNVYRDLSSISEKPRIVVEDLKNGQFNLFYIDNQDKTMQIKKIRGGISLLDEEKISNMIGI